MKRTILLVTIVFSLHLLANAQTDEDTVHVEELDVTKTEPESKFSPKYYDDTPDSFTFRKVPDNVINTLKKDDAFWYADSVFKKKSVTIDGPGKNSKKGNGDNSTTEVKETDQPARFRENRWLSTPVFVAILVLFIGLIAWFLIRNNVVGRRNISGTNEEPVDEHEDIFSINYQRDIDNAIRDKNYRLAIRLMFLRLLRDLSDKHLIEYKQDRTNFEYLAQLHQSSYYQDFFRITRNYEYAWYGKFDVSDEAFGAIKKDFDNLDRKLS
jgi:hypothetical protein